MQRDQFASSRCRGTSQFVVSHSSPLSLTTIPKTTQLAKCNMDSSVENNCFLNAEEGETWYPPSSPQYEPNVGTLGSKDKGKLSKEMDVSEASENDATSFCSDQEDEDKNCASNSKLSVAVTDINEDIDDDEDESAFDNKRRSFRKGASVSDTDSPHSNATSDQEDDDGASRDAVLYRAPAERFVTPSHRCSTESNSDISGKDPSNSKLPQLETLLPRSGSRNFSTEARVASEEEYKWEIEDPKRKTETKCNSSNLSGTARSESCYSVTSGAALSEKSVTEKKHAATTRQKRVKSNENIDMNTAESVENVSASSNGKIGNVSVNPRKRKLQAVNISLIQFVHALWEAYKETRVTATDVTKRFVIPKNILSFLRYAPNNEDLLHHLDAIGVLSRNSAKRSCDMRPIVADTAAVLAKREATKHVNEDTCSGDQISEGGITTEEMARQNHKQAIMLQLLLRLMVDVENAGIGYQFSREALKSFLATYSRLVTPDDFANAQLNDETEDATSFNRSQRFGTKSNEAAGRQSARGKRSEATKKSIATKKNEKAAETAPQKQRATAVRKTTKLGRGKREEEDASKGSMGRVALGSSVAGASSDRHNRSNAQLPPGGILLEYVKGISSFLASISRSDPNDLDALCFILRNKISLQSGIYTDLYRMRVQDLTYEVDKQHNANEPGYARIAAVNFKRAVLLLGHSVILQLDGQHWIVPSPNIEKDVPSIEIPRQRGEFVVLDVMLGTRNKILDVIDCSLKGVEKLPRNYLDRLEWASARFPSMKCVSVSPCNDTAPSVSEGESGYVRKPLNDPRGISYIYAKPPLTAAVVGFNNKHVHLAFRERGVPFSDRLSVGADDADLGDRLVGKAKCLINGPATFAIGLATQHKRVLPDDMGRIFVTCNGKRYELLNVDGEEVYIFPESVLVEFKDGNKLGGLSDHDVSSISEFKPPSAVKDSAIAEAASVAQHDLKRFFAVYTQKYGCREFLAQIQEWNRNMVQPLDFSDYD